MRVMSPSLQSLHEQGERERLQMRLMREIYRHLESDQGSDLMASTHERINQMCQTLHPNNAERRRGLVQEAYASVLRLRQEVQEIAARQDEDSGLVNPPPPPNPSLVYTIQPSQPSSNSLASRQPLDQDDRLPLPNQPPRRLTESQRIAAISEMVMQRRFLLANRIIRERANSRRILIARRMVGARANSQPVPGRAVGWLQRHPPSAISRTIGKCLAVIHK